MEENIKNKIEKINFLLVDGELKESELNKVINFIHDLIHEEN